MTEEELDLLFFRRRLDREILLRLRRDAFWPGVHYDKDGCITSVTLSMNALVYLMDKAGMLEAKS